MWPFLRIRYSPWILATILIIMVIALFIPETYRWKVLFLLLLGLIGLYYLRWLRNQCGNYTPPVEKTWCGRNRLPNGYQRYGTRYECLKKGIGLGRCLELR